MCTRALWPDLWAFPRGMSRDDGIDGTLSWTSNYGSVVATAHDLMSVDGLNDAGLAAHQLFLPESQYGIADPSDTALSVAVWMQYILDQFDTVAAAVEWMRSSDLKIVAQNDPSTGLGATLHLALEDTTGDSAIIEYLDGSATIHHGPAYTVMTNSPPFAQQLELLSQIEGFGGERPLPGGTDADQRFARAAHYLTRLPAPKSQTEAVASLLSVMRNASQPFRLPDPDKPFASQTIWRTIIDLTAGAFVFEATTRPNVIWVNLAELDLSEGAPAQRLDLSADNGLEGGLVGNVSNQFVASEPMAFLRAA